MFRTNSFKPGHWVISSAVLALLLLSGVRVSQATEIIPSVGWSKAVEGEQDGKVFGGLALRNNFLPFLKTEIAVAYREESRFDDALKLRMWPVTGSLYLQPLPFAYAGAGVGWYNISYDYADGLPFEDETKNEFGVHVGGGVGIPLAPMVGLDLNGKYVMLREQDARLVPEKFDPDFWTTSLGLAIKF